MSRLLLACLSALAAGAADCDVGYADRQRVWLARIGRLFPEGGGTR